MTTTSTKPQLTSHRLTPAGNRVILAPSNVPALAGLIAATLTAGVLVIALLTGVVLADQASSWLEYRFPGVPAHAGEAVLIFEHNLTALLGVLGLFLIAQIAARRPDGPGPVQRAVQVCAELSVAAAIAANTLVVGVSLGAYGTRMLRAMLPHGPVELAAYTLTIALYLHGRRQALPARQIAATIATSVTLLAVAAVLETFVTL